MNGHWPRPPVLDRIPRSGDAVIEASAGTGKTYTLEHLVIDLVLLEGLPLEQILVVTFTEKAAGELSARLRGAMNRIHRGPWPASAGWRIDGAARRRLTRALSAFDAASISTIHAFCKRMLAEHAFVNRRLFQEELVDGRAVFHEAFLSVVRRTLATDPALQTYLTAWLQRAPLDALGDRLFEAHTRRGRVVSAFDPERFDANLRALARMPLTPAVLKPTLQRAGFKPATMHAILNRVKALRLILDDYAKRADAARALGTLDQEDRDRRRDGGLIVYLLETLRPVADDIPRLAELYRGLAALDAARAPLDAAVVQVALPIVQQTLHFEKRASGRFDFDDMLGLVDEALRGPGRDALLSTLRRRFRVALIDEFQDTDRVQWSIFKQVFADGPEHRLVVIGDPKQAIYGFRGADVHTYLEARAHLLAASTPVVHLTDTYRATPSLAGALNQLFDQSRARPFFTGDIRYDHPVRAQGAPPELELDGAPAAPVHVFAVTPKKDTLSPAAAARTLNARIADEIRHLLSAGRLRTDDGARPLSAADVFVLTRTTQEGLAVAEALRARGLPYAFYKQDGLFQTREARDVRNLLAAVAEPQDRGRRLRAWLGPFFAVPLAEAQYCLTLPGSHPLLALLFRFRGMADDKRWAQLFSSLLADTGIIQRELLLSDSERELTNYLHIFEILLDEALRSHGTLTDLLDTLGAFIARRRLPEGEDGNVQRLESERAAVQIMTMHKAKGLEAAVVFVTGGLDRNPGFAHVYHEAGERRLHLGDGAPEAAVTERQEEDQRLAYVALTRAKSRLYLPFYGGLARPVLQRLTGTYAVVDRALDAVLADPNRRGFTVEPVAERARPRPRPEASAAPLLRAPPPPAPAAPDVTELRAARRGPPVTSYSRLKEAQGGYQPSPLEQQRPDADRTDRADRAERDRLSDPELPFDALPGGTASGRFIHEMLELADLETVRRQASWPFWAARPDVQALFRRGLRRYDRRAAHLPHSYQMVFDALTTPLTLGEVRLDDGIAGADRVLREMEFLYSVPAREDGSLLQARPRSRIGAPGRARGYVKGFIDAIVEHRGRVVVLDWKTDLLAAYDAKTLTAHVDANYGLQADLYTLALVRLLGIHSEAEYEDRFAGTGYVFVRGLDATGAGMFFARPRYDDVMAAFERLTVADLTAGARP